jgi:hypothetical protein
MRKHNLISLIYANLEKTSAAVEEAAQASASRATPMHACRCDRWGHLCTAPSEHAYNPTSAKLLSFTGNKEPVIANKCIAKQIALRYT